MHEARKSSKGDPEWPRGGRGWVASVRRGIGEEDSADLMGTQNRALFRAICPH